jgi:hypothetical protein
MHLVDYFIRTIYDKTPNSYDLMELYNSGIYSDLVLDRIASSIYQLDTLLLLPMKKMDKIKCLKYYLLLYTNENQIKVGKGRNLIELNYTEQTPRTILVRPTGNRYLKLKRCVDGFKCESVEQYMQGLGLTCEYTLKTNDRYITLTVDGHTITASNRSLWVSKFLHDLALPQLILRVS